MDEHGAEGEAGAGWDDLAPEQRQALYDAWPFVQSTRLDRPVRMLIPGLLTTELARRQAREEKNRVTALGVGGLILLGGLVFGAAGVLITALMGWSLMLRVQREHAVGSTPTGLEPRDELDPTDLIEALVRLGGEPWKHMATKIRTARASWRPARSIEALETGPIEDQLAAFAALAPNASPAAPRLKALAIRTVDLRGVLARNLLASLPEPPAGLEFEELAVCTKCMARWKHDRLVDLALDEQVGRGRCRRCGSGEHPQPRAITRIIAVLGPLPPGASSSSGSVVRVRAFDRAEPFDLDAVEIRAATDGQVEAFCILVGNDPDEVQAARTRRAEVIVERGVDLSPTAVEMLRRTFGSVVVG